MVLWSLWGYRIDTLGRELVTAGACGHSLPACGFSAICAAVPRGLVKMGLTKLVEQAISRGGLALFGLWWLMCHFCF